MKSVVVRFIAIIALLAIITNARKLDTKNNKFNGERMGCSCEVE